MKLTKNIIILILALALKLDFSFAQNYPVQVTTLLNPPFSGYLPDYGSLENQNLKLIVLFNDFTKPSYTIKLKFKLSGQNINLQSKNFYYEGPFTLIPGVPLEISGADIAGLLNSNNLDFTGLSKQQYETSKVLPEGLYTICFTAYDFNNPVPIQVSNQSCYSAWMMLNDPPFLNLPFCGNVQPVTTPQNVIFQWTSLNLVSPNSGNNTNYEFSLYEIMPKGASPNNIIQTLQPIYQTTTNITTLNYGLTEPVLNVGMDYVWRVKAIDLTGRDLFKNQGYSQQCTFTYGSMNEFLDSSAIALNLHGVALNYRLAKCYWDTLNVYKSYRLYYRKQNGANWFTNSNLTRSYDFLQNLEPNSIYEAYVKGVLLDNGEGPASNTVTINTPQKSEFVCGQTVAPPPTVTRPLLFANVGQIWEVGQFDVVVTSLKNAASSIGRYSGYGKVAVPFLGNANFNVKFDNILVNEEFQIISGQVDVLTSGLGTWLHNIELHNAEENATYINGTITSFSIVGAQYCYTLQAGAQICDSLPTTGNIFVVRDEEGNQYTIQLSPPPATVTGPTNYLNLSSDSLQASENEIVNFSASANQNFGFDKKEYAAFIKNYEAIKLRSGKNYFVSNKSIGLNQTDEVIAEIKITGFDLSELSFRTNNGTLLNKAVTSATNQIKITGIPADAGCVYAWYNNKKIGKLNVYSLKAITKKLVVVPVGSASLPFGAGLSVGLNGAFKQSNVTWSVTTAPNFTFNLGNDGLEEADATLMSKYSTEMRALRDAYKLFDTLYDKEAYYIFVVANFNNPNLEGYMVRGRAVGFVSATASIKEIAHELAHGAFALEHTFPKIAKGTSNNLMDYTNGMQLVKEQWNLIQNGKFELKWRDDEEDAQYCVYQAADNATIFETLKMIKRCYNDNKSMPITQFGNGKYLGYSTEKVFVAGIQYDYIFIYKDLTLNPQKTSVSPKNNITSEEKPSYHVGVGNVPYGLIKVDNSFFIEVPADRRANMEYYLKSPQGKNLLLFVNGYRPNTPSLIEKPNSSNKVYSGDVNGYWSGIDAQFMNRIGTENAIYVDGHHSVSTSNHRSQTLFLASMESSMNPSALTVLNTIPNVDGFMVRYISGLSAANDFKSKLTNNSIVFDKNSDTLDIVSHSMGYACAVGFVDGLISSGVRLGRFYILAPENACSKGTTWTKFTEVWQYGSNLNEPNADPIKKQDGVAPQCECKGLTNANNEINTAGKPVKTGRVFIPPTVTTKSFTGSHTIANYGWIFNIPNVAGPLGKGYVKARN